MSICQSFYPAAASEVRRASFNYIYCLTNFKLNDKIKYIIKGLKLSDLLKQLKIPLKKVAIELNEEIIDKKKINKIKLKKNEKIEIVHFIGGG